MTAVTPLIARFRAGSRSAFAGLFALFFPRQVRQADAALAGRRGLADGEDVALSAFRSLWREGTAGNFPGGLDDTAGLLAVLHLLTAQKARKARRYDRREKRDVRRTVPASDRPEPVGPDDRGVSDPVADLPLAATPRQRAIAGLLAGGWVRDEIAQRLGCSVRTVDRELAVLRTVLRDRPADPARAPAACQGSAARG